MNFSIVRKGLPRAGLSDIYHFFLTTSWSRLVLLIAASYTAANLTFAGLYLLGGDCIANARPGSFADAFFFSFETMATIGYGNMTPVGMYANVLSSIEAFLGMLATAMATGLMFAKFARPTSRVIFSRNLVMTRHDGQPALIFRMANARGNQIVEAQIKAVLLRDELTLEGLRMRRFYDLEFQRKMNPVFTLSWTAIHIVDEKSPLYGETAESLAAKQAGIIALLTGIDETFSQSVHARCAYQLDLDLVWNARFADILTRRPDGMGVIDYTKFDDIVPMG
jgi:inward rectifier potassium channel